MSPNIRELYKALKCSRWGDMLKFDVGVADHGELIKRALDLYIKEHETQLGNAIQNTDEQVKEHETLLGNAIQNTDEQVKEHETQLGNAIENTDELVKENAT